jgi:mRNA interferase MazF
MVSIVPLTTAVLRPHQLYPVIPAGAGGLRQDSTALVDQLTSVDISRVLRRVGTLSPAGLVPIVAGLHVLLRL